MSNKAKIDGEVAEKVKTLAAQGWNPSRIGKEIGVAKDTVKLYCLRNDIKLTKGVSPDHSARLTGFIETVKKGENWTKARKMFNFGYDDAFQHLIAAGITPSTRKDAALRRAISDEEVQSRAPKGDVLLGFKDGKYIFRCGCHGNIYKKVLGHIAQGCPMDKSGWALSEAIFSERVLSLTGYTLVPGTFTNVSSPCDIICAKGHKRQILRAELAFDKGCPSCGFTGKSAAELRLKAAIESWGVETESFSFPSKRTRPLSIDILCKKERIGIEYNGLYWHNEKSMTPRDKNYHVNKTMLAANHNIELIHIFSDQMLEREKQVLGFLKAKLKKNVNIIKARDCELRMMSLDEAKRFLDEFHIQGQSRQSFVAFGMFYNELLIGVIMGGNHPYRPTKEILALTRLCYRADYTISNGTEILTQALVVWGKENGYTKLYTWSDFSISNGNVYARQGFSQEGSISAPSESRVKGPVRVSPSEDPENKHPRIWDCGKKTWVMDI